MTQDIKYMSSNCIKPQKRANQLFELDGGGEGSSLCHNNNDISILSEQLSVAKENIAFLQAEHAIVLKGLHEEIERLQDLSRDLQFRCEVGGCLLPDNDFFKCSPHVLEQKVDNLLQENADLKRKLSESHQAIDILDQKEKLALWQHHQELEQRDETIQTLEKEIEAKNSTLSQLTAASQGARRKKGNFWRRFSFSSSNQPSTSSVPHSIIHPPRVEHLSREDLPSEMQGSFTSYESQCQSYSSYSSLSDKSVSDDEGLGHHTHSDMKVKDSKMTVKLPPICGLPPVSNRHLLRRIHGCGSRMTADSLAIDQIKSRDLPIKRTNKT